jgi:hypothetical protein
MAGRGVFAHSREDLTPLLLDPPSLVPLSMVTVLLLLHPHMAHRLATGAVNAYSLTAAAVETIIGCDGR